MDAPAESWKTLDEYCATTPEVPPIAGMVLMQQLHVDVYAPATDL